MGERKYIKIHQTPALILKYVCCYILPDIDECLRSDTNNCDENAQCLDTRGSYTCQCNEGFQMNDDTGVCTGKYQVSRKKG